MNVCNKTIFSALITGNSGYSYQLRQTFRMAIKRSQNEVRFSISCFRIGNARYPAYNVYLVFASADAKCVRFELIVVTKNSTQNSEWNSVECVHSVIFVCMCISKVLFDSMENSNFV